MPPLFRIQFRVIPSSYAPNNDIGFIFKISNSKDLYKPSFIAYVPRESLPSLLISMAKRLFAIFACLEGWFFIKKGMLLRKSLYL